ncbi:hypothetical protein BDV06DRAFT_208624 [Aspergillus oleicola]
MRVPALAPIAHSLLITNTTRTNTTMSALSCGLHLHFWVFQANGQKIQVSMPQVVRGFMALLQPRHISSNKTSTNSTDDDKIVDAVLIIDSATYIGGTWASERHYPNLFEWALEDEKRFIPGWKINRYLAVWSEKWDLRRIRLNWKVRVLCYRISRFPSKEWKLDMLETKSSTTLTVTCDQLVLATGLVSDPNVPDIPHTGDRPVPKTHSNDLGEYCREKLGYQPIPRKKHLCEKTKPFTPPKSVAVYGRAKSAFDSIHLFGSLHRHSRSFNLESLPSGPAQVHWIIREDGHSLAWMSRPTSQLGSKTVPSDQAVCTRIVEMMSPCVDEVPKRVLWPSLCSTPRFEGSWMRVLYRNPLGKAMIRRCWKGVDADIHAFAKYEASPCTSPVGIANQSDLWETIRSPNVLIYRSGTEHISTKSEPSNLKLADGTNIEIDLILHATGWMRSNFDKGLFKHETPATSSAYRLFRRVASPSLVAEGDPAVAEVQALWMAALLTGAFDDSLQDYLGLNPYRAGGGGWWWWWKELMAVYGPRSYAGMVDGWMEMRGGKIRGS